MDLVSRIPILGLVVLSVRLILSIVLPGYLCAYMLKLIVSSAAGESEPPDWPDIGNLWDDILRPAFLVAGTVLVVFLPVWGYVLVSSFPPGGELGFVGSPDLLRLLVVLGALVLPMALLSVAMQDHLRGLNPLDVVLSIAKVPAPYVLTCGLLVLLVLAGSQIDSLPWIPVVSLVLSEALSVYFLMVEMRLIGLLYYSYRLRLNWFDEATDRYARGTPEV